MSAQHTPGEWVFGNGPMRDLMGEHFIVAVRNTDDAFPWQPIAVLSSVEKTTSEDRANAALIAAAPELLAALERALSWLTSYKGEGTMGPRGPYEQARAAIAKATGSAK